MVFGPHLGRLAARHQPEYAPPLPTVASRTVSVHAALMEALRLFDEGPGPAVFIGLVAILAALATALPAPIISAFSYPSSTSGTEVIDLAGLEVPVAFLMLASAAAAYSFLGAPLLAGVYASAIRSARQGRTTCAGLFSGFTQYPSAFVLGALTGAVTGAPVVIPVFGWIIPLLTGPFMWAALSALADRRRGPLDALSVAATLVSGRLLPLLLLNLAAGLIGAVGGCALWLGLLVTVPLMVLMLGVGYSDALEAARPDESALEVV